MKAILNKVSSSFGVFLFVATLTAASHSTSCNAAALIAFERPNVTQSESKNSPISWDLRQNGIVIFDNGQIQLGSKASGKKVKPARLPMGSGDEITNLYVQGRGADIFLAADVGSGGNGGGMLCRIAAGSTSIRWCRDIPSFNVSAAMGSDGAIFVGAMGFIARIDSAAGRVVWQQSGLYKKDQTFNVFCGAEEDGNVVSMFGTSGGSYPSVGKRIRLDRMTGAILSISTAVPGGCRAGQFYER